MCLEQQEKKITQTTFASLSRNAVEKRKEKKKTKSITKRYALTRKRQKLI